MLASCFMQLLNVDSCCLTFVLKRLLKDGRPFPSWKLTLFWFLRWNSSPTTTVDFTRCFLPSHLWNHSCEEEEQVWRSHFTPFSVRPTAAIKLRWPTRLCFSFLFPCKSHRDWNTNKFCITDRLRTSLFQFLQTERPISVTVAGFLHPTDDWRVYNRILIYEMLLVLKTTFRRELWFLGFTEMLPLHKEGLRSGMGAGCHMWTLKVKRGGFFFQTLTSPLYFLFATHRSHRRSSFCPWKLKWKRFFSSSPERREESEVMEAVLLWYVDWRETTLSILEKKKEAARVLPSGCSLMLK